MKKLVFILTMLISFQSAAICASNGKDTKDDKKSTELVEIKGKYDKQGLFRLGLQFNTGVIYLTGVESTESHLNGFSDFGFTADKFLPNWQALETVYASRNKRLCPNRKRKKNDYAC